MNIIQTEGLSYQGAENMTEELKQSIADATHKCRLHNRATDGSRHFNTELHIVKGTNIHNSQIELRTAYTGNVIAYYSGGDFWTVRGQKLTLLL